ncbi:unnamed protein product [Adineta ricciae]|uniref:Uncharacterized protein n=1 Tax=Adineta ricciae TaxID=249248 RepID=A0A815ZSM7_ADIRI|nr:unnamed protein product [Adineta ricciae]CAF1586292.1 unnamed protein product [Adineta ricciae]
MHFTFLIMATWMRNVYDYIFKLNFFDTETDDEHVKRNEILSTRIYIIVLIIILSLFIEYSSLATQTTIITISSPTQKQFEQLQLKYSIDLKCPCKQFSIPYKEFISVKVKYNEICSSDFVSQQWIDYLYFESLSYYHPLDFRRNAPFKFQLLRTLCQQAIEMINNSLEQFYSNDFITIKPISMNTFNVQLNSTLKAFQQTTFLSFQNLLRLIREEISENRLYSAIDRRSFFKLDLNTYDLFFFQICYKDNTDDRVDDDVSDNDALYRKPEKIYLDINKYDYSECISSSEDVGPTEQIPGMFVSSLPIESLMYSTLECLFDQKCLNIISLYIHSSSTPIHRFSILTQHPSTKYQTIKVLANRSFVEEWINDNSYEKYYNYCQPLFCEYRDKSRNAYVYIFTTTISLFGGLKILLPLIIINIVTFIRKKKQQQPTDTPPISMRIRLCIFLQLIKNLLMTMNIFNSYSSDEHRQKNEIISTKVYFLVLIICLVAFTFNLYIKKEATMKFIPHPTRIQFEELQNKSVENLQCPCTNISVKYSEFVYLSPIHHEICSSVFVSSFWKSEYNIWIHGELCDPKAFDRIGSAFFSLLSKFCKLAKANFQNELTQFYDRQYITTFAVVQNQFNHEISSLIGILKDRMKYSSYEQHIRIYDTFFNNQIYSQLQTGSYIQPTWYNDTIEIGFNLVESDFCSCAIEWNCVKQASFCDNNKEECIPGIFLACNIAATLLSSTTECFFDQDCLNLIKSRMKTDTELYKQLQPLNRSKTSRYVTNATFDELAANLFIENWSESYSYDKYYNSCKPSFCSYKIQERPKFVYILIKLINTCGALTIILKFLIPNIVYIIRRKPGQRQGNIFHKIRITLQLFLTKLLQLNFFRNQSNNLHIIRQQIISTRVYLITFITILVILVLYTSLNRKTITNTIQLTELTQYEELYTKYPHDLICPCNKISIKYENFISLIYTYSEVCSSDFVSREWIWRLYQAANKYHHSFYAKVPVQFSFLMIVCGFTGDVLNHNLHQFHSTRWFSNELISMDLFQKKVNTSVRLFKKSMAQKLKETFDMTREILHGNAFISALRTNWKFMITSITSDNGIYYTKAMSYNNRSCTCATSLRCSEPLVINNITIKGLFIGCYPVEAMLQSSLECFYDETCYNLFLSSLTGKLELASVVKGLKSSYPRHETIQQMVDRLFVDEWHVNDSYENYFQACNPTHCTYSFIQNFNTLKVINTIFDYYGGLNIILSVVIPFIVRIIFQIYCRRRQILVVPNQSASN